MLEEKEKSPETSSVPKKSKFEIHLNDNKHLSKYVKSDSVKKTNGNRSGSRITAQFGGGKSGGSLTAPIRKSQKNSK